LKICQLFFIFQNNESLTSTKNEILYLYNQIWEKDPRVQQLVRAIRLNPELCKILEASYDSLKKEETVTKITTERNKKRKTTEAKDDYSLPSVIKLRKPLFPSGTRLGSKVVISD